MDADDTGNARWSSGEDTRLRCISMLLMALLCWAKGFKSVIGHQVTHRTRLPNSDLRNAMRICRRLKVCYI